MGRKPGVERARSLKKRVSQQAPLPLTRRAIDQSLRTQHVAPKSSNNASQEEEH